VKLTLVGLLLTLGVLIACGPTAPQAAEPAAPVSEAPAVAPVKVEVVPTAVPAAAAEPPAAAEVTGTVTIMQAVWGNQLFDTRDASAEVRRYGQLVHGFWLASNEKVELIPGIAESWNRRTGLPGSLPSGKA
jgi:hypothetical protein